MSLLARYRGTISVLSLVVLTTGLLAVVNPKTATAEETRANPQDALTLLTRFYTDYLNTRKNPKATTPVLAFTRAFDNAIYKNTVLCKKRPSEICGFGADGDPYLDAQDFADDLNAENARLKLDLLSQPGLANKATVRVRFLLFPTSNQNQRQLQFKLNYENGAWRVDDIIYTNQGSARSQLRNELRSLLADKKGT